MEKARPRTPSQSAAKAGRVCLLFGSCLLLASCWSMERMLHVSHEQPALTITPTSGPRRMFYLLRALRRPAAQRTRCRSPRPAGSLLCL